jgi:hypothetical protein
MDWQTEIKETRVLREESRRLKRDGQLLDLGPELVKIFIAFSMSGNPKDAIEPALGIMADATYWTYTEITDPYEEGFSKLTAGLNNCVTVDRRTENIHSRADFDSTLEGFIDGAKTGAAALATDSELADVWSQTQSTIDDVEGLATSIEDATSRSKITKSITTFGINALLDELDSAIRAKTKIHTAAYAYTSARLRVLDRLIEMEDRAASGALSPAGIVRYNNYLMADYVMSAVLFSLSSKYWSGISDMAFGAWDLVVNAGGKARQHASIASNFERAGKYSIIGAGARWRTVENRLENSINVEATNRVTDGKSNRAGSDELIGSAQRVSDAHRFVGIGDAISDTGSRSGGGNR